MMVIVRIDECLASAQLKKVRFSTTGIFVSELSFKVAQLKGFWREEGPDVESILIRGAVATIIVGAKEETVIALSSRTHRRRAHNSAEKLHAPARWFQSHRVFGRLHVHVCERWYRCYR
jgi:hypothetical protein